MQIESRALRTRLGTLALSHLRQRRLEIAPVTFRAHPTLRTGDALKLSSFEDQELMGLACPPEHSNSIFPVLDGPDAADSPVPNSNAITNRKSPSSHSSTLFVFPAVKKNASTYYFCLERSRSISAVTSSSRVRTSASVFRRSSADAALSTASSKAVTATPNTLSKRRVSSVGIARSSCHFAVSSSEFRVSSSPETRGSRPETGLVIPSSRNFPCGTNPLLSHPRA
jgi:hypothetical protein